MIANLHCTMVQVVHSIHFYYILNRRFRCKQLIYKQFQTFSDTFNAIKTLKNVIFTSKNGSKNSVFTSFFIKID